jgi:hypothetical protein
VQQLVSPRQSLVTAFNASVPAAEAHAVGLCPVLGCRFTSQAFLLTRKALKPEFRYAWLTVG